jgi:hypothetical protein
MPDDFTERLRLALRHEARRAAPPLNEERLRSLADAPPDRWRPSRRAVAAGGTVLLVALVVGVAILGPAPRGGPAAGLASAPPSTGTPSPAVAVSSEPGPITLADCRIEPVDAPLAFAGWATLATLHLAGAEAAPGQPVYALVTLGTAERAGRSAPAGGPSTPRAARRIGCVFDPSTGGVSEIGVPAGWTPPQMIDGCPASPEDQFAGYREVGGPRAWVLLPTGTKSWTTESSATLIVRLSPSLRAGDALVPWAQALVGGARVDASSWNAMTEATASPSEGGAADATASPPPAAGYAVVDQPIPAPGCWVLNVSVNGALAGSAIVWIADGAPITPGGATAP